jgi:hypothetical protein
MAFWNSVFSLFHGFWRENVFGGSTVFGHLASLNKCAHLEGLRGLKFYEKSYYSNA